MRLPATVLLALLAPLTACADLSSREKIVDLTRLEVLHTVEKRYTHCIAPSGTAFAVFDANIVRLVDPRDGRQVQSLIGHVGMIHDAGWSRDGSLIATSGYDETVRVWETATGRQILSVRPVSGFACSVAFSPDGRWLAAGGSEDGQLKIIDVASGRIRTFQTPDMTLYALEFTADGRHLIVNHTIMNRGDTSIRIFRVSDWTELKCAIRGPATSFAVSRDGRLFAYSTPAGTISVMDTSSWTELRSIDAHPFGASSLAFHPRGRFLASSGRDGAVRIWDAQRGTLVHCFPIKGEVDSRLVFGADEESLVVATADATVKLYGRREVTSGSLPVPAGSSAEK
ncbi:MAG TPA: WD40 repeat domain-containing protein [Planctomycetota bacterium]|nr:WD40 repeat domain-containing protein [Planctomycetota bacterium]